MTDDQVKEAVERLTLCAKWCDTKDMTIKGQKERAAFAADIRAMLTRNDALQAERDKLSAEVHQVRGELNEIGGKWVAEEQARRHLEAKLTALVEALDLCLTGGNHIAGLLIDQAGPGFSERLPPGTDHEIALRTLHATDAYELWCCWNAIMRARDIRDAAQSAPPTTPTSAPVEDVGGLVTLRSCPPGLFRFGRTLGFRTEYQTEVNGQSWPEAFCLDSGEFFWGGTKTHEDRARLMVQPVALSPSLIQPQALDKDELADLIADAISDSLDMDWSSRDGARAVVAALVKENIVRIKP